MRPSSANTGPQDVFLWSQLLRKRTRLRGCSCDLEIFEEENVLESLKGKITFLRQLLAGLQELPNVAEIRQCGMIAGIEVRRSSGEPFHWRGRPAPECASRRESMVCSRVRSSIQSSLFLRLCTPRAVGTRDGSYSARDPGCLRKLCAYNLRVPSQ